MELKLILESILFASEKPINARQLRELLASAAEPSEAGEARAFKTVREEAITDALEKLEADYAQANRSFQLVCVAGAWQLVSRPEFAPWLKALLGAKNRPPRLSQPALETLAIVAYRQPLTRAEMEQVRGVSVDGVIQTLVERGLIEQVGRAEVVGRPMTYGTTGLFLEYFGLRSLDELPAADELRRIPLKKPEGLLTAEPGLATLPPEQLQLVEELPVAPSSVTPSQKAPPAENELASPKAKGNGPLTD